MSPFKIGDSQFRPVSNVSGKKLKEKEAPQSAPPSKSAFDTASVNSNRLAVMPRMSTVGGQDAQHVQSKTVESLLKDSAAELDEFFAKGYGFDE
ncbi:MAG: hypothetical protein E7422_02080 [Ruminococcaceae bacterium]|jgi:hypothetical protein|nr:hypothetical protein [Oscillospiraceae bacterium]